MAMERLPNRFRFAELGPPFPAIKNGGTIDGAMSIKKQPFFERSRLQRQNKGVVVCIKCYRRQSPRKKIDELQKSTKG